MRESRQQRRARERAERKAATRPGPTIARRPQVLEVTLGRYVDPDDPAHAGWAAEWGLRGDIEGVEDSNDDLQDLVAGLLEDAQRWTGRFELHIEWTLEGDRPAGGTIADAVAACGVHLPRVVP